MRFVLLLLLASLSPAIGLAQRPADYPRSYDALIAEARSERGVRIYGTTDRYTMRALIAAFERRYPGVAVDYVELGSSELFRRLTEETRARRTSADIVWSSAMDLQAKLVNDGYAQAYQSPEKPPLPPTAVWKNMGYGITSEPVGFVYNTALIAPRELPRTHEALERFLRSKRGTRQARGATYDPAQSNVGYLYLSEDYAITHDTRSLLEAIAGSAPLLSATTAPMLEAVASGRVAIGYNIPGSYALLRARRDSRIGVVFPRDYTIVAARVAFIARDARHPAAAKLFLDFLLSRTGQTLLAHELLLPMRADIRAPRLDPERARPIRVGPQLLATADGLKRQRFLADWKKILAEGMTTR